jgi:hypothetical protein
MVFNATFNNISVISWRSVLLVEETGVPGENRPDASLSFLSLQKKYLPINTKITNVRRCTYYSIIDAFLQSCIIYEIII